MYIKKLFLYVYPLVTVSPRIWSAGQRTGGRTDAQTDLPLGSPLVMLARFVAANRSWDFRVVIRWRREVYFRYDSHLAITYTATTSTFNVGFAG